ncbi:MAG: hypothetical protein P1U34_05055 [Coxiellaceae bacterium]|nr:hypothetical protein [Coxiellaceae bacterium]
MATRTTVYTADTAIAHITKILDLMNPAMNEDNGTHSNDTADLLRAIIYETSGRLTNGTSFDLSTPDSKHSHPVSHILWTDPDSSRQRKVASLATETFKASDNKDQYDSDVLLLKLCAMTCLQRHHRMDTEEIKILEKDFEKLFPVASTAEVTAAGTVCAPLLLAWAAVKATDKTADILGSILFPVKALRLVTYPVEKATNWASTAANTTVKGSYHSVRGQLTWRNMKDLVTQRMGILMLNNKSAREQLLIKDREGLDREQDDSFSAPGTPTVHRY